MDDKNLFDHQKDALKWARERARSQISHRRFMSEEEYVDDFKKRGESVPPFLVFQHFEIREGVRGYLVPCKPDHPDAEKAED